MNLDTKGTCFICLKPPEKNFKHSSPSSSKNGTAKTFPLKTIFNLLTKIEETSKKKKRNQNIEDWQRNDEEDEDDEEPEASTVNFNVALCEGCGSTYIKVSDLFNKLETIQIQIDRCLAKIHGEIEEAFKDPSRVHKYAQLMARTNDLEVVARANRLRKELSEKSSSLRFGLSQQRQFTEPETDEKELEDSSSDDDDVINDINAALKSLKSPSNNKPLTLTPPEEEEESEDADTDAIVNSDLPSNPSPSSLILRKAIFNPKTGRYKCTLCPKEYAQLNCVYPHFNLIHLNKPPKRRNCEKCGKLLSLRTLPSHQMKCTGPRKPAKAKTEADKDKADAKLEPDESPSPPPEKPKVIILKNFTSKTGANNKFYQPVSTSVFKYKMYTHDPSTNLYKCTSCLKTFASHGIVYRHYHYHHLKTLFKCLCQKSYRLQSSLHRHKKRCKVLLNAARRGAEMGKKTCGISGKQICDICGKKYLRLKTHKDKVHSNSRAQPFPVPCDKCHKGFSTQEGLQKHKILIHSGRTKKCEGCNKDFRYPWAYHTHKRMGSCSSGIMVQEVKDEEYYDESNVNQ